jgi:hypothetical protein
MMTRSEEVERLHKKLPPPAPDVIRAFRNKGVSVDALVEPELPALVDVVFHADLPLFDFTDEAGDDGAVQAIIFAARDEEGEPLDLVAWSRKTNRLAAWFGAARIISAAHGSRTGCASAPALWSGFRPSASAS